MKNIIGLVPARSGSQRVENKNIRLLDGQPLIAYTIEAAKHSRLCSRVVVSTDSPEIARISRECGADVPFVRPAEISRPDSTEMQFLLHALDWFREHEGHEPDLIVLLYPTSPFRKAESIDSAVETILAHPEADSLRSVRRCTEHPFKMWMLEGGYLMPYVRDKDANVHTLSYQCLPTVYIQNASIYITRPKTVRLKKSPVGDIVVPFVMDDLESVDINTPLDFRFAEWLMKSLRDGGMQKP